MKSRDNTWHRLELCSIVRTSELSREFGGGCFSHAWGFTPSGRKSRDISHFIRELQEDGACCDGVSDEITIKNRLRETLKSALTAQPVVGRAGYSFVSADALFIARLAPYCCSCAPLAELAVMLTRQVSPTFLHRRCFSKTRFTLLMSRALFITLRTVLFEDRARAALRRKKATLANSQL